MQLALVGEIICTACLLPLQRIAMRNASMKIVGKNLGHSFFQTHWLCLYSCLYMWLVQAVSQVWDAILSLAARIRCVEVKWVISDCSLCQGQPQVG